MRDTLEQVASEVLPCTKCVLHKSRTIAVPGEGDHKAKIMFIGEGPGAEEDRQGRPFVGRAGKLLDEALILGGLKREEVYITNAVKCFVSPRVLVYTAEGYRGISTVKVGDLVLTHTGRFRRVNYIRPRESLPIGSKLVRITCKAKAGSGNQTPVRLSVTPEHPLLVNGKWIPASDTRIGDSISALGDSCEVCGRGYYVRHDSFDHRKSPTCSYRCNSIRAYHNPESREIVGRSMLTQYANGVRDPHAITERANQRTQELVLAGLAKIQHLTPTERHLSRVTMATNMTAGTSNGRIGYGEPELRILLDRLGVQYNQQFAFPGTTFVYDFCLTQLNILIEVRGPGFGNYNSQVTSTAKYQLAKVHGYLLVDFGWLQILQQPQKVEGILDRLIANHEGRYVLVELDVVGVDHYYSRREHTLYNFGVEDDESYLVDGIVSHNCRPPKNRTPLSEERHACRPYLDRQIDLVNPRIICLLGRTAVRELLGARSVGDLRGRVVQKAGRSFFVTFHPAASIYNKALRETFINDIKKLVEVSAKIE